MIHNITEQEFRLYEGCRQIVAEDSACQFAALDLGDAGSYALGWNSSKVIQPELELSFDKLTVWIGVNQYLVGISLSSGRICLSLKLHTNILEIKALEKMMAIRAETEILLLDSDFSIFFNESFPDITEEIQAIDNTLKIHFLEGSTILVDLHNGNILNDIASNVPHFIK